MMQTTIAQLCLNKERTFKNLQKEFDESMELIELQIKEANEKQVEFVKELDSKYGQGKSYDLSTGNKDVEKKMKVIDPADKVIQSVILKTRSRSKDFEG